MEGIHPGVLAAAAVVGDLLHALVRRRLADGAPPPDPFRGMHVDASDAERLISRPLLTSDAVAAAPLFTLPTAGASSPLGVAARGFGLTPFETLVVVLALLPEIDARYGTLFGFLHDDVTRKSPSVELALALCAPDDR